MRGGIVNDIRLAEQFPIDVHFLVHDLDAVAGQTDHALHEVLVFLVRKLENNNVAALKIAVGQNLLVPRTGAAEDKLVDQQVVANEQSAFHGSGGNLKSLHDEGRAKQ